MRRLAWRELFLLLLGISLLLAVLVLNNWTLPRVFSADGNIENAFTRLAIWTFDIIALALGLFFVRYHKSPIALKVLTMLIMTTLMVLLVDWLLYRASPLLPQHLLGAMSPHAQLRFFQANPDQVPWIFDGNIRYPLPNDTVTLSGNIFPTDSLGYRNPQGYVEGNEPIDILLLGDSFTMGTLELTIADYMRDALSPQSVYSMGVFGDGPPHWPSHYERFVTERNHAPAMVVLNFYSGNDIADTEMYIALERSEGHVDPSRYTVFNNFTYLVPSGDRSFKIPKPPELFFLSNYALAQVDLFQPPSLEAGDEFNTPLGYEPHPDQLNEQFLGYIDGTIATIRNNNPDTQIVFSYLPTPTASGEAIENCPTCQFELDKQVANSEILAQFAAESNIYYFDITTQLQTITPSQSLWADDGHFNAAGYQIYAEALAHFMQNQEVLLTKK